MAAGGFGMSAVALLEEVHKCHDEGNAAFRSHNFSKAREKYELALTVIRELYEKYGWDPYVMSVIVEKDQKLLCNLSKVHRLLGHVTAAIEVGKSCVDKYPDHAKGYYCLAEAHRASIDLYPLHLAFQPIREAVIHFSVAFKLSHDKQAFLECLVLSIPGGLYNVLPRVLESEKRTVFQHAVDCLIEKPESTLEVFLRFFLIQPSTPNKPTWECGPGCGIGYITFKKYNLKSLFRNIAALDVLQALLQHEVQVDVGTIVDVIKHRHTSKSEIVKMIVPYLPKAIIGDCAMTKPIVDACLQAKQSDLLEYLLQQGMGLLPESEEQILQWKSSSAAVSRMQESIRKQQASKKPPGGPGTIERVRGLREQGTAAYKAKRFREAKDLYTQAYESLPKSAVALKDPVMSEEMQKVLGNLSVVERSLKNYGGSVKWAKKCVEEFPKHAKSLYRLAEAYRDQASGLKSGQRTSLLTKSAETFGQVYTLSEEKLAYFECLMAATETGSLHIVPSVPASEKDSLAQFVFEHLQMRKDRPEEVAHFIHTILNTSPKVLQQIATPLVPACLQDCSLSMLPSSKLPLADLKTLIEMGMMVDMDCVCENIEGRKDELDDTFEELFLQLPPAEKSPSHLQRAVGTAVLSKAALILVMLLKYGAVFPDDPKLKALVFSWNPEMLSVHIIKNALKGEFPKDVQRSDVIQLIMRRAECVRAWGTENLAHKRYAAARSNFEEAIECFVGIEKISKKKAKAVVTLKLKTLCQLSVIECTAGELNVALTYGAACIEIDASYGEAYQRMADVYIKKAEIAKTRKEASETRRSGFDMYMRAYRLQRTPELFTSMLAVAVMEGEGCLDKMPELSYLKRSEAAEMLHYTLKSLLDKSCGYPKELVRKCVIFLLIPKPLGVGSYPMHRAYGQTYIRLDDFTLSEMLPVVGFHPWSIQQLVEQGIQIDSASVVTGIKEVAKTKEADSEKHQTLLMFLYERCTTKEMRLFLDTAISVKETQLVQRLLNDGARISENNMKALLSWDAAHLLPSLVRAILQSNPPLHVKNSKGESIVSFVARYDMTDCIESLLVKGVKVPGSDVGRVLNKHPSTSALKALINQGAKVTLDDLSVVVSARKNKQATPEECTGMTKLICDAVPAEDLHSHTAQDWLRRCIQEHLKEIVEVLLGYGICPTDSDAYQLLSWKSSRVTRDMLSTLLKNGMNPTLRNGKGESVLDIVLRLPAYDLLGFLVPHYDDLSCCSLASVFDHKPSLDTAIAAEMADKGATVLPYKDMISPVTILTKHLSQAIERQASSSEVCTIIDNLVLVLERGAPVGSLVALGSSSTTPVHVATSYATQTGFCQLLEFVLKKCGAPSGGQYLNSQGQTPLHEIARSKGKPPDALFDLLLKAGVDPKVKDRHSKTALEYCARTGRDWMYSKLSDYQRAFEKEGKANKKKKKRDKKTVFQEEPKDTDSAPTSPVEPPEPKEPAVKKLTLPALVEMSVKMVKMYGLKEPQSQPTVEPTSSSQVLDEEEALLDDDSEASSEETEDIAGRGQVVQLEQSPRRQLARQNAPQSDFDGLTWEVDCTEKFWKHLGGLPEKLRSKAISVIQRLASGEWHPRFRKSVGGEQALEVYELKLTKGRRIIWQKAIDYSSRCSEGLNKVVYSEIIRLWDVVKHKDIHHTVEYVVDSFRKGRCSHVKYNLQQFKSLPGEQTVSARDHIPRLFVCEDQKQKDAEFSPPALPGERDYNVITFYAFSSALVQSVLSSGNHRQDFPFKGWPEEHDIISLSEGQTILLLGRSGTGKTTCCMYRLWNQCNMYWETAAGPYIRRVPLLFARQPPVPVDEEESNGADSTPEMPLEIPSPEVNAVSMVPEDEGSDRVIYVDKSVVEQEEWYKSWQEQVQSAPREVDAGQPTPSEVDVTQQEEECFDHLRQVFITKNPVLVSQVKKKFYDLAASASHMKNHLPFETSSIPPRLEEISDNNFPLFLTSFKWLDLLDASLDEEPFFPRSEAGVLLVELKDSTGEFSTSPDDIELFDDSESESEEDEDLHAAQADGRETQRLQTSVRRIVDSAYFCDVIWHEITKRFTELRKKYDPILIWMEIRSFLKGSYEALMSENGHLGLSEYVKIGAKRASNFSVERAEVYKLFREYEKYLSQNQLIDQCDWVSHLYRRLTRQSEVSFVIHEVYIDEVQDFTEAELYLIIHCCRFPNGLFLTGDTAQSIMRGVSFRFQDLRSLFHHFSKTYLGRQAAKKVQIVPKVHQLTQNFRSHSGILNLAALCIKLIHEYFPYSIDTLPEDRGLFPGPVPVILHAASTSDLAIILKGNRREASTIEFGAHQAILVQSDEAKSTLPNELAGAIVLTIFEAKGLEFDDVLMYNFFADSKAGQEWRLVLQYLTSIEGVPIENDFPILDQSVLRPVKFDQNQHRCINAELKYFYTAVTRAKCNLWIYDTDPAKHSPMYYFLMKKGFVQSLSVSDMTGADVDKVFVQESTPEEWKSRGDYFMKKRLWEPAQKCYGKCGEEVLAMEAEAFSLVSMARKASDQPKMSRQLCQQAASLFLQCATAPDNLFQRHLRNAATCLYNSKEWIVSAQLYESIQEYSKAFKSYHRGRYFEKASDMKEKQGKYDEALQCLQAVGKLPQALKKALDFRQRGIVVAYTGLTVEDLAYKTAKHHENRQELKLMKECIDLLPDVDDKVRLFKRARLYREAVSLLVSENALEDAFRIQAAQKQYDGGVKLAASKGHGKQVLSFLLMKARALPVVRQAIREICAFQREFDPSEGAPDLSRLKADLATDLLPVLGEMRIADNKYNLTKECPLLCTEMTMLDCICNLDADIMYKQDFSPNVFGMIEQMRIWLGLELAKTSGAASFPRHRDDLKIILQQCEAVVECFCQLSQIGDVATDVSEVTSSLLDWYCIQKDVNSVVMPKEQDVWVSFGECVVPNAVTDEGAMKLDSSKVIRELRLHLYHSLQFWLIICKKAVEAQFAQPSFDAYHRVISDWTTGQLLERGTMRDFLRTCCVLVYFDVVSSRSVLIAALLHHSNLNTVIEEMPDKLLNALVGKLLRTDIDAPERRKKVKRKVNELVAEKDFDRLFDSFPVMYSSAGEKAKRLLLSYFSPETSVYIPLSRMHLDLLEEYPAVKQELLSLYLPSVHRDVNAFMSAWWMKGTSEMQKRLMQTAANDDYHINDMDKKIHCFALWSKACGLFDLLNPRPLVFCKILLDRLFSVVVTRRSLKKFNAINALVILELLTSALIAMLSCQETCLKGNASAFPRCVPHLYAHVVQLFDDSRPRKVRQSDRGKTVRLMEAVYKSVHQDRNVQGMENEARRFLIEVIDLILGKRFRNFNILKHIIAGRNNVKNGTLRRCVILLITLLGNLEFFSPPECQKYRYELVGVLQSAIPQNMEQESAAPVLELCDHLCRAVQTATCTTELFYFASQLCNYSDKRLAVIENNEAHWTMHFRPVHLTELHNVPFPAIPYSVPTTVMTLAQQTAFTPPMVQSATGETAWPDWSEEGQVTQPSNIQGSAPFEGFVPVPTEMSFTPGLSQPTEDMFNTSYEYEEEENPSGFDAEEPLPDISAEKEFIKRGWCNVCGVRVVSEQRTDQNPDLTGEAGDAPAASHDIQLHIQSRLHIDNVNGYKSFEELKNSIQQTLPSTTAILQHAKAMENDRRIDGLSDKLKKAHQKLQEVMTLNIGQQRGSREFWTGQCKLIRTESERVQKLALDLKKLLPEVEPAATSQVHKDSADEEEDGLAELDEAIVAAEESHARKGKKSKKKRQ